ncbi:MAG: glycosyltransferase family 4 protein [Alsobacter sp.]
MNDLRISYLTLEAPRVGQASHVHVSEIIAGLRRRGWEVRLLQPAYTDRLVKPGTAGRIFEYAVVQARLWLSRRRGEGIYVRAHFMAVPTAVLAKLFRIPIVHEINGPYQDIFVTYPWLERFTGPLVAMQRVQYRWADRLLPVTEDLAAWVKHECGHDRVTVISNGANTDLFHPGAARSPECPSRTYVVFFGGLASWHGVPTMLDAVEHPSWPADVDLLIVGNGAEASRIVEASARNPRIVFMGYQPYESIPGLVAPALAGLVPISDPGGRSQTGLMPLKLLETLAAGVPVIVTDFPGQADLVRQSQCGLVVPPEDPGALARAVGLLASDQKEAAVMGRRGAELVAASHSWDRRAADVADVLTQLQSA